MSKLIPDYVFDSIYDITPELLEKHGVRGVLIDLDGTMASHKAALPPEKLSPFVHTLCDAGLRVLVFSNNREARVAGSARRSAWILSAGRASRLLRVSVARRSSSGCRCPGSRSWATRSLPMCSVATGWAR